MNNIIAWIKDHWPVRCANCGHYQADMNTFRERDNLGRVWPLCTNCWMVLFKPFTKDSERGQSITAYLIVLFVICVVVFCVLNGCAA